jgi:hypothetical protein
VHCVHRRDRMLSWWDALLAFVEVHAKVPEARGTIGCCARHVGGACSEWDYTRTKPLELLSSWGLNGEG